jgi:alpha-tubulin suppressor-like RCC1 family protein
MVVLKRSRLAGCVALAAGLVVSVVTGAGAARAGAVTREFPTRSAPVSWGNGTCGVLGDGVLNTNFPADNRMLPGSVVGLASGVVAVSAGDSFAMALTSDGRVWTWGENHSGNLGYGPVGPGVCTAVAAPVPGLSGVVQVAAGLWASYALRSDGTVWAWGNDAAVGGAVIPTPVPGLTGVTQIAAGGFNGSGFVLALRSDGTVWGWGGDASGVLGAGAGPGGGSISAPIRVKGLSGVTAISAGWESALAITHRQVAGVPTTLTTVWAWGAGTLGNGAASSQPQPVPQVVPGLPQVTSVVTGGFYALAVGADGSVWGWGSDNVGQLGNAPHSVPLLRPVETFAPGSKIIQISASSDHTLALRSDGTVLAFGYNAEGQIGDGTTSQTSLPVQVSDLTGATQVSANSYYSLAVHQGPLRQLP